MQIHFSYYLLGTLSTFITLTMLENAHCSIKSCYGHEKYLMLKTLQQHGAAVFLILESSNTYI